jgi:hypothetical protein
MRKRGSAGAEIRLAFSKPWGIGSSFGHGLPFGRTTALVFSAPFSSMLMYHGPATL